MLDIWNFEQGNHKALGSDLSLHDFTSNGYCVSQCSIKHFSIKIIQILDNFKFWYITIDFKVMSKEEKILTSFEIRSVNTRYATIDLRLCQKLKRFWQASK